MRQLIFGIALFFGGVFGNGAIFVSLAIGNMLNEQILNFIGYSGLMIPFIICNVFLILGLVLGWLAVMESKPE